MMFTFHLEACADPQQLSRDAAHPVVVEMCRQVREAGMKVRTREHTAARTSCLDLHGLYVLLS